MKQWTNEAVLLSIQPAKNSSYYIVQYDSQTVSSDFRRSLEKISVIKRYVPDHAFVIKLQGTELDLVKLKDVQWYAPYGSYLKVESSLFDYPKDKEINLNIHLFSGEEEKRILNSLRRHPIIITDILSDLIKVTAFPEHISKIAQVEGIEWIEKEKEAALESIETLTGSHKNSFHEFNGYATGAKVLNPNRLYQAGVRGALEKVSIVDSGLDRGSTYDLPKDLEGRVEKGYSISRPESERWDDPSGHGTHVAGLVAGNGAASQGEVRGVAYEARLIFQSIFKWTTRGGKVEKTVFLPANPTQLFKTAVQDGARVHTNSWGFDAPFGEYGGHSYLIDKFVWENPDSVLVFSIGNGGMDLNGDGVVDSGSVGVPATAKNCITVGASENLILRGGMQTPWKIFGQIDAARSFWPSNPISSDFPSNNISGLAAFSGRGPTSDGRIKPDVVAPGTNNLSLRSRVNEVDDRESWGKFNEDYIFMGGTSMAAPLVAGAAALVREYYKKFENREFISSALVKATLINGAMEMYPGQFEHFKEIPARRPNVHEGFGRINISDSLLPISPRVRRSIDDTQGLSEKEVRVIKVKVTEEKEPLRVTLVYSDYPSSPSVARALVNDLDLTIEEVNSKNMYYPNGLFFADRVNNVEDIDILNPKRGDYIVRIKGISVPFGSAQNDKQPFALVISGGLEL